MTPPLRNMNTTQIAIEARKRHEAWVLSLNATDPLDEVIADAQCAFAWRMYRIREREESERPTWPRISVREVLR